MTRHGAEPGVTLDDVRRFSAALERLPVRQGARERVLRLVIRSWCRLVGWRLEVTVSAPLPQRERVMGAGCVVAAAPHRAWVEPFLLLAAWPSDAARLVWLADGRTVNRSRWRRCLLPRLGVIPIAPVAGGPRAYGELVAAACAKGHAVAVFPEVGPPSPADRTRRISPGFGYLALRAGAPVVPVVIGGTHHIVRGSTFSVDVRAPLQAGEATPTLFAPAARERAHALAHEFETVVASVLPGRTRQAEACAPARDQWQWLARLLG
jgi:1-acyl-sn-glycerol-3-phosphate acyltransferase